MQSLEATLAAFSAALGGLAPSTIKMYETALQDYVVWAETRPGIENDQITEAALRSYMDYLIEKGYAVRTQAKIYSALGRYCAWAVAEGILRRNPVNQVARPVVVQGAPRELDEIQRDILKQLLELQGTLREQAIFALGYWTGMRISEVSHLRIEDCDLNQRAGVLTLVNAKGGKTRTIDLHNQARRALYAFLYEGSSEKDTRDEESAYVFPSQRARWMRQHGRPDNLSTRGINHLWTRIKERASRKHYEEIVDIKFHDLRHDFAHRARQSGWSLEEVAVYLGHQTRDGSPAISTTARYTMPGRKQLKARLQNLKG